MSRPLRQPPQVRSIDFELAESGTAIYDTRMAKDRQDKPGPKPDHLKLEGNWEEAVKKALQKEKPEEGWPDEKDKPKKK